MILSLVLVGAFGIFAFESGNYTGMDCPLAVFSGDTCSAMTTAFTAIIHHISAFHSLMQSVLNSNINILLIVLLVAFASFVFSLKNLKEFLKYKTHIFEIFRIDKKIQPNYFADTLRSWFVLIKNKDSNEYALAYEKVSL